MSFYWWLVRSSDIAEVRRIVADEDPESLFGTPADETFREPLAREVIKALPEFERFEMDAAAAADYLGVTPAEARRQLRHVELNAETPPLQVTIYGKAVSIQLPWSPAAAHEAFDWGWTAALAAGRIAGMSLYDPQAYRIFALPGEREAARNAYLQRARQMDGAITSGSIMSAVIDAIERLKPGLD